MDFDLHLRGNRQVCQFTCQDTANGFSGKASPIQTRACDRFLLLGGKGQGVIGGRMGIEAHFPELVEPTTGADAAERQDVFRSRYTPEHA